MPAVKDFDRQVHEFFDAYLHFNRDMDSAIETTGQDVRRWTNAQWNLFNTLCDEWEEYRDLDEWDR